MGRLGGAAISRINPCREQPSEQARFAQESPLYRRIVDLYVEPEGRGKGIGTALIERLAEIGRASGWLKVYWMTQADNDKAHALYGKMAKRSSLVRYDMHLNGY